MELVIYWARQFGIDDIELKTVRVNNGVVYLDYEDSTSPWSPVLVSMIVLDSSLLSDDDVLFCLRCLSGVPAWRLM